MGFIREAQCMRTSGLNVLPASRERKYCSSISWKEYIDTVPTDEEFNRFFATPHDAVCIICGKTSGNLEALDFDKKGICFNQWKDFIGEELYAKLTVETTQNGGYHVYYRCSTIQENQKLAKDVDGSILIETRGAGGLIISYPTQGYDLVSGKLCGVNVITADERDSIISAAKMFDKTPCTLYEPARTSYGEDSRPGDEYNESEKIENLLTRYGWKVLRSDNENRHYWERPGQTAYKRCGGTTLDNIFYCFTSSVPSLEPNRAYTCFSLRAAIECSGDYSQCAKLLSAEGYGVRKYVIDDSSCSEESSISGQREEEVPPVSEELMDVGGFLGDVINYSMESFTYNKKTLAFCAGLALLSTLVGRKVQGTDGTRTNIYLLALADSGVGKDSGRKLNNSILDQVGMSSCSGDTFASGAGLQDELFVNRVKLYQSDEFDYLLKQIKSGMAGSETLVSELLTIYSSAGGTKKMRSKAKTVDDKATFNVIDQPHLTIYGTAVPEHFYNAVTETMLSNGLFARMLVLEAGKRNQGHRVKVKPIPSKILEVASYWANYTQSEGNLSSLSCQPVVIPETPQGSIILEQAMRYAEGEYEKCYYKRDQAGMATWARFSEHVPKMALLHAISKNPYNPIVCHESAGWAFDIVKAIITRMLYIVSNKMARTDFQSLTTRLLALLETDTKSITRAKALKELGIKPTELIEVEQALVLQDSIVIEKKGQSTFYRLL